MKRKRLEKLLLSGTFALISAFNPVNSYGQEVQEKNKDMKIELNLEEALEKNSGFKMSNEFRMGSFNIQLSDSPRIFNETILYKNASLFTELYFNRNFSENIVGTNSRLNFRNIEISLGGKIGISDSYSFKRYGINSCFGINLNLFKFGVGYKIDIDAFNGKREDSFSFSASFSL